MFDENLAEPLVVLKETLGTLVGKNALDYSLRDHS